MSALKVVVGGGVLTAATYGVLVGLSSVHHRDSASRSLIADLQDAQSKRAKQRQNHISGVEGPTLDRIGNLSRTPFLQAYSGAHKVQKEYLQAQSKAEEEAAAKQTLQERVDEMDKAADILVKECSSLEQASHSCYYVIRI